MHINDGKKPQLNFSTSGRRRVLTNNPPTCQPSAGVDLFDGRRNSQIDESWRGMAEREFAVEWFDKFVRGIGVFFVETAHKDGSTDEGTVRDNLELVVVDFTVLFVGDTSITTHLLLVFNFLDYCSCIVVIIIIIIWEIDFCSAIGPRE
jgi:hypothetical protein